VCNGVDNDINDKCPCEEECDECDECNDKDEGILGLFGGGSWATPDEPVCESDEEPYEENEEYF